MSPKPHDPANDADLAVEFAPIHRPVLLSELQTLLGVLHEAIDTARNQGAGDDSPYIAAKHREVAAVSRAVDELQSTPAGQAATIALPERMMLALVHGAADYAVELLQRQLGHPTPGTRVNQPADLRYDVDTVQAWTETLIAVSERVSNT